MYRVRALLSLLVALPTTPSNSELSNARYKSPIFITENGVDVPGESSLHVPIALEDQFRVDYYRDCLRNVSQAASEGIDLRGYSFDRC